MALAVARRSPLVGAGLALAAWARSRPGPAGTAGTGLRGAPAGTATGDGGRRGADDPALLRWVAGLLLARLLVPALLVPVALVASLALVLGTVALLAGGITVAARLAGLG